MKRILAMLVLPGFLLACDGSNPFAPDPPPPEPEPEPEVLLDDAGEPIERTNAGIPEPIAGDLRRIIYDPKKQTLKVVGLTLDDVPFRATFKRKKSLDRAGYQAYTVQDDPLDRHVTAYVRQSNSGRVRAGTVVSGGPRNRFFGGGYYERDGDYDPPNVSKNSGLVSYAGRYVGLTNLSGDGGDLRPVPAGTPQEITPNQSAEVRGKVLLQADFADNVVEGNIYERRLVDTGATLPSLVLVVTDIQDDGTFLGSVEYDQADFDGLNFEATPVVGLKIGDYGGIFGGRDASAVGGVVHLDQFDGPNDDALSTQTEEEYGTFVLDQCGRRNSSPVCNNVNPDFSD